MNTLKFISTLFVVLLLFSCKGEQYDNKYSGATSSSYGNPELEEVVAEQKDKKRAVNSSEKVSEKVQRKLIKKGNVAFETDNLVATRKKIDNAVKKFKGYISSENEYNSTSRVSSDIEVRIPSVSFDAFLADISSDISRFDSKNISVNDVTEQFLDIQARLKVKKELESRYTELLKKAKSVKEILEVESELTSVRSDIESMEGRLKYLQNQVSFSTLTIRFYKVEVTKSASKSFWRKLANAFLDGIDGVKIFFLGLVSIWPFLLLIVLVFIFIRRKLIKRKK